MNEIYVQKPVTNITINSAINSALPDDVVIVPNGIYNNFKQIVIPSDVDGTPELPITLKAETPGGVTFTGNCASPLIFVQGDWWIIRDFQFINISEVGSVATYGMYTRNATGTRITNNYWEGLGIQTDTDQASWVIWLGHNGASNNTQIDHNTFFENEAQCINLFNSALNCQIDHNHFKQTLKDGTNIFEGIKLGDGGTVDLNTIVEYNLFENMYADSETISSKSSNNTFRYNVFKQTGEYTCNGLILRAGDDCTVESNYFFNVDSMSIRVHGTGHKIINNYFENSNYSAILLSEGDNGTSYDNVADILISGNTIVNPISHGIYIGWWPGGTVKPADLTFKNNIIISDVADSYLVRDAGHTGSFVWENNLHYTTGTASYWRNEGGGNEPGTGITHANPNLTTGYEIYRLQASSVNAINKGTLDINVTDDIDGQLRHEIPDIGCDEYYNLPPVRLPVTTEDVGVSWLRNDLCKDILCENVCIGTDLYSQKCDLATGNCITDQLIESNSETCGYDPCLYTKIIDTGDTGTSSIGEWLVSGGTNPYGVNSLYCRVEGSYTWETILPQIGIYDVGMWWTNWPSRTDAAKVEIYDGNILVDTKFVNQLQNGGQWNLLSTINFQTTSAKVVIFSKGGEAAAALSTTCADAVKFETAKPCEDVCVGTDLYSQKCDPATGNCINDQLLESNSAQCIVDPCEGVVCEDVCVGFDLYSQKCDPATGNCVNDQLIESNSITCGYVPPDPCEGVVCEDVCVGIDLYSQKCDPATGNCINDQLLESNSAQCIVDPCEGVVCPDICIGTDLYSQKCDPATGNCVTDQLIESNSITCGYVPPDPCEGVVCEDVCVGIDLYSQKCDPATGNCINDQLLESNSAQCIVDPCEGVVCPDICIGTDLYSQKCVDGECVADQLIEPNSVSCMVPTDEDNIMKYLVFGGLGLVGFMMLLKDKK